MDDRDFYWVFISRDDADRRSSGSIRPIFERLEASFLPKPATLQVPGAREATIAGWLDPKAAKAIDVGKRSVGFVGQGIQASLVLPANRISMSLFFRPGPEPVEIRRLFLDLCDIVSPTYARAGLNNKGQELDDTAYAGHPRTFYADGLYWLNFFGPDEEARQGGPSLADNPYALVRRQRNGLLIQVGESGMEMLTPEGEARLVAATRAMPPVPSDEPGPVDTMSVEGVGDAPREPAPIITVGGVRGFLDPVDRRFWVSKHLDPPHPLDKATLRSLAKLPGKGTPSIKQVAVLFSTEEAAQANKTALEIDRRKHLVRLSR